MRTSIEVADIFSEAEILIGRWREHYNTLRPQ
jgi:hypothetical protein